MLFDKNYAIITHRLFTGAGQDMYTFLKKNDTRYVLLVQHSFSSAVDRKTTFTYFTNGVETITEGFNYQILPDSVVYIKDFLYSFFGILVNKNKFDVIVGCGGFNAFCALVLKYVGKCNKVIFYTIDYVPKRFENTVLNNIYHLIDRMCVKHCDQTWNVSKRIADGRKEYDNIQIDKYNQKVVPIGIWLDEMPEIESKYETKTLVFVGHLLEKQGVQLVIQAIPKIIQKINDFNFVIVGSGEYESELKKLVYDLEICEYVNFKGSIFDPNELNTILGRSHLSIAMYDREKDNFTYYADPTKVKTYLAMGLPVLLTNVPHNAEEIELWGCGKIINYDVESIATAIIELMNDDEKLIKYSSNAIKYIKQFDWNNIFMQNLGEIYAMGD